MFTVLCTLLLIAASFLALRSRRTLQVNPKRLPYPPGPRPLPILGNALDMPKSYYWVGYNDWAKEYGDLIHTQVFGQHYILLNSLEAAEDLLEKRSAIYSSRPRLPMIVELCVYSTHSLHSTHCSYLL
jgi:hypothetical protein